MKNHSDNKSETRKLKGLTDKIKNDCMMEEAIASAELSGTESVRLTKCKTCGADSYIGLDGREIHGKYLNEECQVMICPHCQRPMFNKFEERTHTPDWEKDIELLKLTAFQFDCEDKEKKRIVENLQTYLDYSWEQQKPAIIKFISSLLKSEKERIMKEVIDCLPEKLAPERPRDDYHDYIEDYNSAIQTIREKLNKYFL